MSIKIFVIKIMFHFSSSFFFFFGGMTTGKSFAYAVPGVHTVQFAFSLASKRLSEKFFGDKVSSE